MYDVTALGELLIDFTAVTADAHGYPLMQAHPGGAPSNLLAALSQYGARTALIGKVGNDAFGKLLKNTLDKRGIDTRGLSLAENVFTTLAFVTLDTKGDRSFSFARKPGADTCLRFDEIDLSLIDESRILHFGSLSLTDEPARSATKQAVAYAKSKGKLISYDPNLRMPLWKDGDTAREQLLWGLSQADIIKISDNEIDFLLHTDPETGAERLLAAGARLVFVTCGSKGCYFANRNVSGHLPALQGVRVKDTTGAGDIFGGSALWMLLHLGVAPDALQRNHLLSICAFANAAAGLSTEQSGGIGSVPALDAVLEAAKQYEGIPL